MKRHFMTMMALMLCVASSGVASVQGGRRGGFGPMGGGGLQLLRIAEVQKELKMTPAQTEKLESKQQEMGETMRQIMQEAGGPQAFRDMSPEDRQKMFAKMQDAQKKVIAEILDATQQKRFRQLELQQAGTGAFARKDVAEELKLTKEQTEKISAIQRDQQQAMRDAMQGIDFQNMTDEDRQKMQTKMAELQKSSSEKSLAVLTAEQQKQWKEMTGEPFKFPARRPGPPR